MLAALPILAAAATGGLRINGVLLPQASLALLRAGLPMPVVPTDFEAGIIDNRLLAGWAQTRLSQHALHGLDSEVEAELMQLLHAQLPQAVMPPATALPIDDDVLRRLLSPSVQSGFQLTSEQQQQAAALVVLQLPRVEETILKVTLWDVYRRESIQGLAELHALRRDYLLRQASALLQQRWQLWRWQQDGRLDAATLAGLSQLVRDKQLKQRWLLEQGLTGDFHHESAAAQMRRRQVSEAAMKQYYDANLAAFRQVDTVSADVLLLGNQADADASYAALQSGLSFAEALQRDGKPGSGALGIVRNDGAPKDLLAKLALLQRSGISRPFRVDERWAIFQVRERHERVLPFTDASVKHECARAVALAQAQSELEELRRRLHATATIERVSP